MKLLIVSLCALSINRYIELLQTSYFWKLNAIYQNQNTWLIPRCKIVFVPDAPYKVE